MKLLLHHLHESNNSSVLLNQCCMCNTSFYSFVKSHEAVVCL